MTDYKKVTKSLNRLQNTLDKKYFEINEKPTFKSKTIERVSIYNLSNQKEKLEKVIFIQRYVKRWLEKVKLYKEKIDVSNNKYYDDYILLTRRLYNLTTLEALKRIEKINNEYKTKHPYLSVRELNVMVANIN